MNPIRPIKIRAGANPDGEGILLTIGTKYGGETTYAISRERLEDLLADLRALNTETAAAQTSPAVVQANPPAAAPGTAAAPAAGGTRKPVGPNGPTPANSISVKAPKRWMLGNGLPAHPMVVLVLDPQTDQQAGYAFDPKAAREMAINLVKNADAIAAHQAKKP